MENKFKIFMTIIFIIFILCFVTNLLRIIKWKKNDSKDKKNLVNNNEFVLKNKGKIEKVMDTNSDELKSLRKNAFLSVILFIISLILIMLPFGAFFAIPLFIVSAVVLVTNMSKYRSANEEKFVDVVNNALHEYDSDLEYRATGGFGKSEYHTCLFPETCDRFHSEDMVTNSKKEFCYADITVKSEHEDSDGDKNYVTEYQGSLARMSIKNTGCRIFLGSTSGNFIYGPNNYKSIKFENDEFNKLFRASSDNELLAYKLLTPDIMEEFVNLKKNTYGDIDIRIIYDKLYIRFSSGNTFDSRLFNKKSEKKELLQSIAVLEEVIKTMDKAKKIIDSKIFD